MSIKFYQGTEKRTRTFEVKDNRFQTEEYQREYLVSGVKVVQVGKQEPVQHPKEYAAFKALCEKGEAPKMDDSSDALKVVEDEAPAKEAKSKGGIFKKGDTK